MACLGIIMFNILVLFTCTQTSITKGIVVQV
jgi:hypothetical protein